MSKPEGIVEAVGASVANKGMLVGASTGFVGWLSQVNWVGFAGVAIALIGFLVNTYFQIRKDRREAAESQARIQALREQCQRGLYRRCDHPHQGRRTNHRPRLHQVGRRHAREDGRHHHPDYAAMSAGWFWQKEGLNSLADKGDILAITKRINGGTNGLDDRKAIYRRALEVLQ